MEIFNFISSIQQRWVWTISEKVIITKLILCNSKERNISSERSIFHSIQHLCMLKQMNKYLLIHPFDNPFQVIHNQQQKYVAVSYFRLPNNFEIKSFKRIETISITVMVKYARVPNALANHSTELSNCEIHNFFFFLLFTCFALSSAYAQH